MISSLASCIDTKCYTPKHDLGEMEARHTPIAPGLTTPVAPRLTQVVTGPALMTLMPTMSLGMTQPAPPAMAPGLLPQVPGFDMLMSQMAVDQARLEMMQQQQRLLNLVEEELRMKQMQLNAQTAVQPTAILPSGLQILPLLPDHPVVKPTVTVQEQQLTQQQQQQGILESNLLAQQPKLHLMGQPLVIGGANLAVDALSKRGGLKVLPPRPKRARVEATVVAKPVAQKAAIIATPVSSTATVKASPVVSAFSSCGEDTNIRPRGRGGEEVQVASVLPG